VNYPLIKQVDDFIFEVQEDFQLEICLGKTKLVYEVKKGFKTDFASVPRFLWWFIPPIGKYSVAALIHDDLYKPYNRCDRFTADAVFRIIMMQYKCSLWHRLSMYYAVRAFGWVRFNASNTI
jgi:hypothetical protein